MSGPTCCMMMTIEYEKGPVVYHEEDCSVVKDVVATGVILKKYSRKETVEAAVRVVDQCGCSECNSAVATIQQELGVEFRCGRLEGLSQCSLSMGHAKKHEMVQDRVDSVTPQGFVDGKSVPR